MEHHTERKQIGTMVRGLSLQLLGRHVRHRAHHRPGLGQEAPGLRLAGIIARDLTELTESDVVVDIKPATETASHRIVDLPGDCIDDLDVRIDTTGVDANLLKSEGGNSVEEALHSHLLRSNCPVTNQPDMGSVLIRYRGSKIDRKSLLRYIVSYRQHNDFHEACVERMFIDIKKQCNPKDLTVYARYNRRGGLDINPFRSDFETSAENLRLWRQ